MLSRIILASLAGFLVLLTFRAADLIAFLIIERGQRQVVSGELLRSFHLAAIARSYFILPDRLVGVSHGMVAVSEFTLRLVIIGPKLDRLLQLRHRLLELLLQPVNITDAEVGLGVFGREGRSADEGCQRAIIIFLV